MFDLLLFGILTAQACKYCFRRCIFFVFPVFLFFSDIYYISFPGDRALLKIAVVGVYLAGVAQTAVALLDFQNSNLLSRDILDDGTMISSGGSDHLWLSITALTAPGM